ncbi:hypothetical protein IE077_003755, partial [Cardiosporidium cionae]
ISMSTALREAISTVEEPPLGVSTLSMEEEINISQELPKEAANFIEEATEAVVDLTLDQMDVFLHYVLLDVLHNDVKDEALPEEMSSIYSKMLNASPFVLQSPIVLKKLKELGVSEDTCLTIQEEAFEILLNLKRSSYKKLSKFTQAYVKKKLIQSVDTRGITNLVKVNRSHP